MKITDVRVVHGGGTQACRRVIDVPNGPGLGIEIDPDWLARGLAGAAI